MPAILWILDALAPEDAFLAQEPAERRRHAVESVKRVILRESRVQPLLLVFEDLHWVDAETQIVLDSIVESLPTAPVLLAVNYRPEYRLGQQDLLPPASRRSVAGRARRRAARHPRRQRRIRDGAEDTAHRPHRG